MRSAGPNGRDLTYAADEGGQEPSVRTAADNVTAHESRRVEGVEGANTTQVTCEAKARGSAVRSGLRL